MIDPTDESRDAASTGRAVRGWLITVITIGTLIRLVLAGISYGTNDFSTWGYIGHSVAQVGLLETYRIDGKVMNHPPLPVLWAWLSVAPGSPWVFSFLMKLPAIAGDALATALLGMIYISRGNPRLARSASLAMAMSPIAILISGYHCNTDNLYAALSLLAIYLAVDRKRFFWSAIALGAAINVKLIPILLIPILFALCRRWRDAREVLLGLAVATIPFLPLLSIFSTMRQNMLQYLPPASDWGIVLLLRDVALNPNLGSGANAILLHYSAIGRGLIILCPIAASLAWFLSRKGDGYALGTLVYAFFLVLAPGFGAQYLVAIVPLLLAVSIRRAWIYGSLAGLYALLMYAGTLVRDWPSPPVHNGWPLLSVFANRTIPIHVPGSPVGLLAWAVLVETIVYLLIRRRRLELSGVPPAADPCS